MDVFSLLKFWRFIAGGGGGDGGGGDHLHVHVHVQADVIVNPKAAGEFESSIDDEESFFDFVFANTGDEKDYSCVASPSLKGIDADNDDDVDVDVDNDEDLIRSKSSFRFPSRTKIFSLNSPNTTKSPQSPLRLLKLGFQKDQNNRKSKLEKKETEEVAEAKIGAMLTRDNSLRHQLRTEKLLENDLTPSKRFSKEVVNKYLNLMKPSYVKDYSKRSTEKSRLSEKPVTTPSSSPASSVFSPRKEEKRGGRAAVFRDVRKHLGKSRSASAILQTLPKKNDDSAVEQQDGIQSAILHCKRSYDSPSQGYVLSRSGSDPSNNKPWISSEEENRSSI